MYTLKPPLQTNCSQCQKKLTVKFMPPCQQYSNKNHWGYWTGKKENQDKYTCDTCLIDLYRNQKQKYLDSITDSKKRRTFRKYFGGKVSSLLTKTQQRQLEKSELHEILRKKGVNLDDEDRLGDLLEEWRQAWFRVLKASSLQAKRIEELEKKLVKKQKRPLGKSKT